MSLQSYERGARAVSISTTFAEDGDSVLSPAVPYTDVEFGLVAYLQQTVLPRRIAWEVLFGTVGNVVSHTILLEGSLDGTNWFTLDTYTTVANTFRHVVDKPVRYLRAKVNALNLTISTSTTITVSFSL